MISERIREARKVLKLSQSEAALMSGIPLGTLRKYEHGPSRPGAEAIIRFTQIGINPHWLLTGKGTMLLNGHAYLADDPAQPLKNEEASGGYVALPPFSKEQGAADQEARTGPGKAGDALMFKKDWIRTELNAEPVDLRLIRISGDSMEPTLRAGDMVLADTRARHPDHEGIYILSMDDALFVKRIQIMPGGILHVSSDNAAFVPWPIKLAELEQSGVTIIGRVVWSGGRL